MSAKRIIISGGGTGGHIFPAISIANQIKKVCPEVDILFIGAKDRMEMEKVPAAGYPIVGLPIKGFNRKNPWSNIGVLFKIGFSVIKSFRTMQRFKPQIVIGVGGYASGPALRMAAWMGIPTLIQEQNSYAGVTNKLLAKHVNKICVAYEGMERFFPAEKIILTGNPVRSEVLQIEGKREQAYKHFDLDPNRKTILIVGGSLGAGTINKSIAARLEHISQNESIQLLWQCGKFYYDALATQLAAIDAPNIHLHAFLTEMDLAYAAADLVISRAGASSISELCLVGKATILIPSPNVAEDHQTVNAQALVRKEAAVLVADVSAENCLVDVMEGLINDEPRLEKLRTQIAKMALPDSAEKIVEEVLNIIQSTDK